MVRDLVDAVVRDVADRNAPRPRGGRVHVVEANPIANDGPGPGHRIDDLGVHGGELDHDGIRLPHQPHQLRR